MSTDRQYNKIVITCDSVGCNDAIEGGDGEDWNAVWSEAKAKGWKTRKIAGEWVHACPTCPAPT